MTAWQRIGSICTTDSAAGPEKLRQKAMAKSTAISLDRVLVASPKEKTIFVTVRYKLI